MDEIKTEEVKIAEPQANIEEPRKKIKITGFVLGLVVLSVILSYYFFLVPFLAGYFFNTGRFYFENGAYEDAKKNFKNSLFFNSKKPQTYGYLGTIELGQWKNDPENWYPDGNYEEAIKYFNKAIEHGIADDKENYKFVLQQLGDSYRALRQHEKSDEYYLKRVELYPDYSFWARYYVARDYIERLNKPREALDLLSGTIETQKFYEEPAGRVLSKEESPSYIVSIKMKDADRYYMYKIYTYLSLLNDYFKRNVKAANFANLAIWDIDERKVPELPGLYVILARVDDRRGENDLAKEKIKKAGELAGDPKKYDCVLPQIFVNALKYSEAIDAVRKIGKMDNPRDYSLCVRVLGSALASLGKKDEAIKYLEEYLKITDSFEDKDIFIFRQREKTVIDLKELRGN